LYAQERANWAAEDYFRSIGPIQFEFKTVTPYLIKAPSLAQLYFNETKSYSKNAPFAFIDPKHSLGNLGAARMKLVS
jgi:hypothetical protein